MKNSLIFTISVAVFLMACETKHNGAALVGLNGLAAESALLEPELYTELYGNWVGDFVGLNKEGYEEDYVKANIIISRITEEVAEGKSVVKGNYRSLTGKVTKEGNVFSFVLEEPGDDKHDGRFTFTIVGDTLSGEWIPYTQSTAKLSKKEYSLTKMPFVYNANLMLPTDWYFVDYSTPKLVKEIYKNDDGTVDTFVNEAYRQASEKVYQINASIAKLTEAQVKNLRKLDLEILRNTIFARHGYAFKSRRVRQFFDYVEWYIPVTNDIEKNLTDLEKENIALLQRFEQYATDNYDVFGR